jgi:hypothetical protein
MHLKLAHPQNFKHVTAVDLNSIPTLAPHAEILQIVQGKTLNMRVAQVNVQKRDLEAARNSWNFW